MPSEPPPDRAVARPRPATPAAVLLSLALLVAITGAAAAQRSFALAAYLIAAALIPWAPRERALGAGVLLAYAGVGWCLFEVMRVPLGSRVTVVLLPACAALLVRARALGSESVIRWARPRWAKGVTAPALPLDEALAAALERAPLSPAAVDAAVVALSVAPPSVIPEREADRRAFWINAHNVMVAHAGRGRRSPRFLDALEVLRTEYVVAGVPLTPADITLGLLRRSAPGSRAPWSWLYADDPRMRWAVPLDPRIHFALSAGALSSPRPRLYHGSALDAELDRAAQTFLVADSEVDEAKGTIEVSRVLRGYARDIGGEEGVRALLGRALGIDEVRMAALRLRYRPFDWTSAI